MGFMIRCLQGAKIKYAGEVIEIPASQINQVAERTERLDARLTKRGDERWKAVFVAQTEYGLIIWRVIFSQGDDADPCLDEVDLESAPPGVEVEMDPYFDFSAEND